MPRQILTLDYPLVYQKSLIDVADFNERISLEHSSFSDKDGRLDHILSNVLHQGAQRQHLMVHLQIDQCLSYSLHSVKNLTWLQDLFVLESSCVTSASTIEKLSERVVRILHGRLRVRQSKLCRGCKQLRCHQDALGELMHVFAFIAHFG